MRLSLTHTYWFEPYIAGTGFSDPSCFDVRVCKFLGQPVDVQIPTNLTQRFDKDDDRTLRNRPGTFFHPINRTLTVIDTKAGQPYYTQYLVRLDPLTGKELFIACTSLFYLSYCQTTPVPNTNPCLVVKRAAHSIQHHTPHLHSPSPSFT